MPIKTFGSGEVPDAADLNRYPLQQAFRLKTADESVASSTTLQDDNHLFLSVAANTEYWVQAHLIYEGAANPSGDLQLGWSFPSGSTWTWVSDALGSGVTGSTDIISRTRQVGSGSSSPGTVGAGILVIAVPKGVLRVGSNSGFLRLRWAQLASTATPTIVKTGSLLTIRRLTT
ncbi:hypothetical protein [Nonomuraea sp. NPDC050202]|uniref:hypothetical protein n=1 Tax=Nonomuraea sp. NPDC050202 TaxID=3155035 RepID=UPI0033DE102B